jgi:hypothetical protein
MKKRIYVKSAGMKLINSFIFILIFGNVIAQNNSELYIEQEITISNKLDSSINKMGILMFGDSNFVCTIYTGMGMDSMFTIYDVNKNSVILINQKDSSYFIKDVPIEATMSLRINDQFSTCEILGDSLEINGILCHNIKLKTMISSFSGETSISWIAKSIGTPFSRYIPINRCFLGLSLKSRMEDSKSISLTTTKEVRIHLTSQERKLLTLVPPIGFKQSLEND